MQSLDRRIWKGKKKEKGKNSWIEWERKTFDEWISFDSPPSKDQLFDELGEFQVLATFCSLWKVVQIGIVEPSPTIDDKKGIWRWRRRRRRWIRCGRRILWWEIYLMSQRSIYLCYKTSQSLDSHGWVELGRIRKEEGVAKDGRSWKKKKENSHLDQKPSWPHHHHQRHPLISPTFN